MLFILILMVLSAEGSPVLYGTDSGSVKTKGLTRFVENPGKYPYLVHLKIVPQPKNSAKKHEFKICGGVLIKDDMVLTAAHCLLGLNDKSLITATAGAVHVTAEKRAQIRNVKEYELHEVYKKFKVDEDYPGLYPEDDLAMLWLTMPFKLGEFLKLAKLSQSKSNLKNKEGKVVGWGLTEMGQKSEMLKKGKLRVVENSVCSNSYQYFFTNKAICILANDRITTPCEGDSGGPFVVNGIVEGIISFGTPIELASKTGKLITTCNAGKPVVVTSVKTYLPWINYRITNGSPSERREMEHVQNVIGFPNPNTSRKQPGQKKKCDKKTKKCTIM